jgi:hypothetical protein
VELAAAPLPPLPLLAAGLALPLLAAGLALLAAGLALPLVRPSIKVVSRYIYQAIPDTPGNTPTKTFLDIGV